MEVFQFGDFTLDVTERRLQHGFKTLSLAPKAVDVLTTLVRQHGRIVTKEDLLARVWPDVFVEEGILTVHVSALRKALGHGAWIETVPRIGYRFTGPVPRRPAALLSGETARSSLEVAECLRAGRTHLLTGASTAMPAALAAFSAAARTDPECAAAHAGVALTWCVQANLRVAPHQEAYAEAKAAALRALAMDSHSADAQAALGGVLFWSEWNWAAAERSLQRALLLDPEHCEALLHYGALRDALDDRESGLRLKERALAVAPQSPLVLTEIALSYSLQRRFTDALAWARKAITLDPLNQRATEFITVTSWFVGDVPGLIAERRRRAMASGLTGEALVGLERRLSALNDAWVRTGHQGATRWLLENFAIGPDSRSAFGRAASHAVLGNVDEAFEHLDHALTLRDPLMVYLAVYGAWQSLRSDARFNERLKRLGLPINVPSSVAP